MIFAPFTGKDNHGKIVTFGAALLCCEDNKTYAWVFEKFTECIGRPPSLLITDQDPAMKIAVERVLPNSTHRLCMWHIMRKVPEKTPAHLKKNDSFRKRLNDIVWSDFNDVSSFESQWNDVMVEFDLVDDSWFNGLYAIRHFWIPPYFRDIPMSGICRTTSISESVNSFFNNYLSYRSNLVEFLMHFDSAMDAQRHANDMKTPLQLEKHAASLYTTKIFRLVQEEIETTCFTCNVEKTNRGDGCVIYDVDDGYNNFPISVTYQNGDDSIICSCNKFTRDGIICCHMFSIFKLLKLFVIPQKYIVGRWTKTTYSNASIVIGDTCLERRVDSDDNKIMINKAISQFYFCVDAADGDKEKIGFLLKSVNEMKDALVSLGDKSSTTTTNNQLFDIFYGMSKPDEVEVLPPLPVKTKGSGSRLKSRREAAIARAKKPLRMCSKCKMLANHEAGNCKS